MVIAVIILTDKHEIDDYIDRVPIPVALTIKEWALTLAGLSLMVRSFNGLGPDKDGLDLAEDAAEVISKIKTRSYDACKRMSGR